MTDSSGVDPEGALARAQIVQPGEARLTAIWIAMTFSILVYAGLTWFVFPGRTVTIEQQIEQWILVFLAMSAGLHVLVVFLLRQMIAALARSSYVVYCVLRWALMEGVGVYGLVLALFGVDPLVASIFYAVAIMLMAAAKPGPSDRAVFVAQYR